MKKLILSCAVALTAAVSFTSCAKDACYECEATASSAITIEVCDGNITTTNPAGTTTAPLSGVSASDYRASLQGNGYNCTDK